jgi:hypothetical protein
MTSGIAFFDEYPGPILGHHPDFLLGLADAATRLVGSNVRIYCPPAYLQFRPDPQPVVVRPAVGRRLPADADLTRQNLLRACTDAQAAGISVLVNLFLDETYEGLPSEDCGIQLIHVLHRPGELIPSTKAQKLLEIASRRDTFVVHTDRGRRQLERLLPHASIVQMPWPAATVAEVEARFTSPVRIEEQQVLVVGGARPDKGLLTLLEASKDGPPVSIVGELAPDDERYLSPPPAGVQVTWERRWVDRRVIERAIETAPLVVFPYLWEFASHGGASASLAQAVTFGKPLIVSDVLAPDLHSLSFCRVIPAGDSTALRSAIEYALRETNSLHDAARTFLFEVQSRHTFEAHVERLLQVAKERQH